MEKDDENSQPCSEQAPEISDDEEDLVIYCAFSDPGTESDEPRPKFDFSKPVQFVNPVRRIGGRPGTRRTRGQSAASSACLPRRTGTRASSCPRSPCAAATPGLYLIRACLVAAIPGDPSLFPGRIFP